MGVREETLAEHYLRNAIDMLFETSVGSEWELSTWMRVLCVFQIL